MKVKTYHSNQKWLDSNDNPIVLKLSYTEFKALTEVFIQGNFDKDKDIKLIFSGEGYSPEWLEIFSETKEAIKPVIVKAEQKHDLVEVEHFFSNG